MTDKNNLLISLKRTIENVCDVAGGRHARLKMEQDVVILTFVGTTFSDVYLKFYVRLGYTT